MLPAENTPVVETLRLCDQVPFADHCCLIAIFTEDFRKSLLIAVEYTMVIFEAVDMTEFSRKDTGSGRS